MNVFPANLFGCLHGIPMDESFSEITLEEKKQDPKRLEGET